MAEGEARKTYPMLSPTHWWALRKKFRQSIPGVVTDSYLATVLNMAPNSARANILPFLKAFGLIEPDGKPTERVKLWRDDESYKGVCDAILNEVYPNELLHAVTDPRADREKAERWFANQGGVGESASKRMTAIYTVLVDSDPSKEPDGERKPATPKKISQRAEPAVKPLRGPIVEKDVDLDRNKQQVNAGQERRRTTPSFGPEVNINLQIHISADASADQIEQIFASMAKHLYKNG